ncbi:MAG: hypothetical protein SXV54_19370 [Chloroflexota bacterium]|nr:hypothetical protein [Chloroflexota bacterium]
MTQTELETLIQCLSDWRVDPADVKAGRYVGQFFNRRRIGLKIVADVEGNYGTYTVSIDAGTEPPTEACSCYIGAGGGCHHVRALAQTFLDDPASFVPQETRAREQVRTLDDLALYLETMPLEALLVDLKAHDLSPRRLGELLGAGRRTLSDAARDEARNQRADTLGALKLACLYLLERAEADARDDDPSTGSGHRLAWALACLSRRELLDLIGEFVAQLDPLARRQFLARFLPTEQPPAEPVAPDAEDFLDEIDDFAAACQRRIFYEEEEVWAWEEDHTDTYEPELEAFDILDDFFSQADRYHQAGEHTVVAAAYEKLFDVVWGDTYDWFGFEEISSWLETDVRAVVGRYLASLGQVCPPEEYVERAWEHVALYYMEHLVMESTPEQLAALEAHLLNELEEWTEREGFTPFSLHVLRRLYEHQERAEDDLALCRRLRLRHPALFVPLLDHAEATGDWGQVEELVRQALALAETWSEHRWPHDLARPQLERRLSRALEQRGDVGAALTAAQSAFYAQPDFAGYQRLRDLAGRIDDGRRAEVVEEVISFLRDKAASHRPSLYYDWPSPEAELLTQVLLAEGRHAEAYHQTLTEEGTTQNSLLALLGGFYLTVGWGEEPAAGSDVERLLAGSMPQAVFLRTLTLAPFSGAARDEALDRATECYCRLMQTRIDARGRDNYAVAAGYAAVLREIYAHQDRRAEFDRWYVELMETYRRFRALKDEFRRRLGAWEA